MATSTNRSGLGPVLCATVATPDIDASIHSWCEHLHQQVTARGQIGADEARQWGCPALVGMADAWLQNELGEPWLRLIEVPDTTVVDPFGYRGWMALEICVRDVDRLHDELQDAPLRIIGEPANLDFSDDIRAMQAVGPAGEVLYLTQVKAEVPPFELPSARCAVDRLFIPVLLCSDRERSLSVYEQFSNAQGLRFETRITVINRARGLPVDHRHPVATIQLAGASLVEIDQLGGLAERPAGPTGLPAGIVRIGFACREMPPELGHYAATEGPFAGRKGALLRGAAGEWIELLETSD